MSLANPQINGYLTTPKSYNDPGFFQSRTTHEINRILPKASGSLYPGKGIYWKYKTSMDISGNPVTARVDNYEYWKPIANEDWRTYTAGDEFNQQYSTQSIAYLRTAMEIPGVPRRYDYGTILEYGSKQYRCTNKTVNWTSITNSEFMGARYRKLENPYAYDNIQVWTLDPSDENYSFILGGRVVVGFYWYHPKNEAFYPLPDSYGFVGLMNETSAKSFVDFSLSLLGLRRTDSKVVLGNQFTELTSIIKNIIPPDQLNFEASVRSALVQYYVDAFKVSPEAALNAINEAYGKRKSSGSVKVGSGKGKDASNNGTSSSGSTIAVRGSFKEGYAPYDGSDASSPQMVQQFRLPGYSEPVTKRYIFILRPNQISYSNIGSEWTDIPRSGNSPLIDWKSYKLMQVSFQFIVVPDREGNLDRYRTENEITLSIDNQLRTLQEMASAPYPIVLLGFDDMITNEVRFPFNSGRGVEFVIADFSVTSLFRTATGAINRAQCDITLREVPIQSLAYIDFPALKFPKTKNPPPPKKDKDPEPGSLLTQSSSRVAAEYGLDDYKVDPTKPLDIIVPK